MSDVNETLKNRGARYGSFDKHAAITQALKATLQACKGWDPLNPSQKEALEMIAHKMGRILNGDPNYADSWHDIAGYATLVENQIQVEAERRLDQQVAQNYMSPDAMEPLVSENTSAVGEGIRIPKIEVHT